MVKKLSRIAALLAAGALLFGAIGCSSGSSGGGGGEDPKGKEDAKTSTWEFSDLQGVAADIKVVEAEITDTADAAAINAATKESLTAFPTHSASGDSLDKFYILEDVEYRATEGDKTMTILAKTGDGTTYNFHNKYYGAYTSTSINVDHSKGALEIKGDALSIADVQGPFSVTVVSTVNGSSDKSDRYAFIKTGTTLATAIAGSPVKQAEASKASGDKLTYTYEGTDKLTVVIGAGGSGSIRVFDVEVTEYESAEDIEDPAAGPGDGEDDEDEEDETLPTVTLFSYKDGTASLTDAKIENAENNFVTIRDVTFVLENDTNSIGWAVDNTPGVAKVNSATYGKSATGNQWGYMGKTAASGSAGDKLSDQGTLAKVSFTVTPKSAVTLKKLTGYLRTATSANIKGKVTINDSHTYTSDQADSSSKVVTLSDTVTGLSAANKFDVTIEFVAVGTDVNHKTGQQFDVFEVKLAFEE